MAFQLFDDFATPKKQGIEYILTIGRRQPMHVGHLKTIKDIIGEGYKPIIVIGSTNRGHKDNGLLDPLFEPVSNPLTLAQQREQIRLALGDKKEGLEYFITEMPDMGDNEKWCAKLSQILNGQLYIEGRYPDITDKTAFHFIGKEVDRRPRRLVGEKGVIKEVLAYFWEGILDRLGIPVLQTGAHDGIDINLSATTLRKLDLNNLTVEQKALFATPDYIINLANEARLHNQLDASIPVTMLDLSLDRLKKERNIGVEPVIAAAKARAIEPGLDDYRLAAKEVNGSLKTEETARLKIASVSLNQTVYDFATNVGNIKAAIDAAVADGADILSLAELSLTGYAADDYHQWNKDNSAVWRQLKFIAEYAYAKDPNLVISLGTPWHYADKGLHAGDVLYNISNRPFNTQVTITGGKVVAMAAKSILADGPAEYEPRQFRAWPSEKGTININLPDGSTIPFGKPVVALGKGGKKVTLFHEQCAEGWPGVNDDLTIVDREQNQARYIVTLSKTTDLSVVINPSASRPQPGINKERIRADGLCLSGSNFCGTFIYTNYLGSESGIYAAEGSQIYAQDKKIIHHGQRYNFENVSYSSATIDVPLAKKGSAHVTVEHNFTNHAPATIGHEADFENVGEDARVHEEYARSISLWLRDYLQKQTWPAQGYLISLSGGADSAYGAIAIAHMIELDVKQEGVEKFFERFPNLKCRDAALKIFRESGNTEKTVDFIKHEMLTCVYLPTDNSSETTLNAARTLVEGGTLPDGTPVKGIGGKFSVHNVQPALDEYIISHAGLNIKKAMADAKADAVVAADFSKLQELSAANPNFGNLAELWLENHIKDHVKKYVNAELNSNPELPAYIKNNCSRPIPTWANPKDDITLQNYQARARGPVAWAIANQEGKIALVTSNASEAVVNYATAGGDMHMGGANPIGGMPKSVLKKSLEYFENHGLAGLTPIKALHYVTVQKPTAELRKEVEGQPKQTDEGDLGFSYRQSEIMEGIMLTNRATPTQAFKMLLGHNEFPSDPVDLRNIITRFIDKRWPSGQFKRIMAPLAPYVGSNVDPHLTIRTTPLGDFFNTDVARMTLFMIAEKRCGGIDQFESQIKVPINEMLGIIERSRGLKKQLTALECPLLTYPRDDIGNSRFAQEIRREYQQVQQLQAVRN